MGGHIIIHGTLSFSNDGSIRRGENDDIVSIATCELNSEFTIRDQDGTWVSPHSVRPLPEFFYETAGLNQRRVEGSQTFNGGYYDLRHYIRNYQGNYSKTTVWFWGDSVKNVMIKQALAYRNSVREFITDSQDLQALFSKTFNCQKMGIRGAARKLGLSIEDYATHCAHDNSVLMSKILRQTNDFIL